MGRHLNWTSREDEEGRDKRVRITMTEKSSSGRERDSFGL